MFFLAEGVIDYWKRFSSALFTGLLVCSMQVNCLYVISLQQLMVKLSVSGAFQEQIGKLLTSFKNLAIVKFEPTANSNLDIEPSVLSTDQMYLYEIFCLVSNGIMPESLAKRHPRNVSHARWLTTANRLIRLYVATESRDENLLLLVNFILKVYAEMWFRKKCILQVHNDLVHLFLMLNYLRDFQR